MENGFAVVQDGKVVAKEEDFGNACELEMFLSEKHPDSKFQVKEFVGCIIES
jgi:hypothetical protein